MEGELMRWIERYETADFLVRRRMGSICRGSIGADLTLDQYETLRYIGRRGQVTSTELAEQFCVHKSAITAIITRLADRGLVQRHPDEKDRRLVHLSLTDEGRRLFAVSYESIQLTLAAYLGHFSVEEIETFVRSYEKLSQLLVEEKGEREQG